MNKKKYIKRIIIIAVIALIFTGSLVWRHFERKKSPVNLFQSLTNENVEIEMYGYILTSEEKTECIELLKKLNYKDAFVARYPGTTPEYGYVLKIEDKEYILYEEYSIYGQATIYYKGKEWYVKSEKLKVLMKEHYEKYQKLAEEYQKTAKESKKAQKVN